MRIQRSLGPVEVAFIQFKTPLDGGLEVLNVINIYTARPGSYCTRWSRWPFQAVRKVVRYAFLFTNNTRFWAPLISLCFTATTTHDDEVMPQVPRTCPTTGQPTSKDYLHTLDGQFVDANGRTLLLRGVNLSGSSKAPIGQQSHVLDHFWSSAQAGGQTFLGRPFDLDDGSADAHLSRLRGWGFNVLRYPITWEALEHEGP